MSACAPTDNAEEETKDNFSSSLQAVLDDIQRHDITLLMRDFSARVGQYNHNRRRVMGQQAVGDITNNGERLVSMCEENDFVTGGIVLLTKASANYLTLTSPDGPNHDKQQMEALSSASKAPGRHW